MKCIERLSRSGVITSVLNYVRWKNRLVHLQNSKGRFIVLVTRTIAAGLTFTIAVSATPCSARSKSLKIDDVPLVFIKGRPVTGGVKISVSTTTTLQSSIKFSASNISHDWTQNSVSSTASETYKNLIDDTVSRGFGAKLGGKSLVSGNLGVDVSGKTITTDAYETFEMRKRDEEERHDNTVQVDLYTSKISTTVLSSTDQSGYAETGIDVANFTAHTASFSDVSDALVAIDATTGEIDDTLYNRRPVMIQEMVSVAGPVHPTDHLGKPKSLSINAPATLEGKPGYNAGTVDSYDFDSMKADSFFRRSKIFMERITDYTLRWNGRSLSKEAVDVALAKARDNDVEIRVIDDTGRDTIRFLRFVGSTTGSSLADALIAAGHSVTLDKNANIIKELDGKTSDLADSVDPGNYSSNLTHGKWQILRRGKNAGNTDLRVVGPNDFKVAPGETYVIKFVTLKALLDARLIRYTMNFLEANINDTIYWPRASALWETPKDPKKDFQFTSRDDAHCLIADPSLPYQPGDHIHIRVKSILEKLSPSPPVAANPSYIISLKNPDPRFIPRLSSVVGLFKPTEIASGGKIEVLGRVESPDDIGIRFTLTNSAPQVSLSVLINRGDGAFSQSDNGVKDVDLYLTQASGENIGPFCVTTNETKEMAMKLGRSFTPPVFPRNTVAFPPPRIVIDALNQWVNQFPLQDYQPARPQEWAVEVTRETRPWR